MAEIINLRMARKQAARKQRADKADANRALHSVPASQRKAASENEARAATLLEGHRRTSPKPPTQD
ncbi:MAG: DUF4169 family protein [Nitratireductor sp.]|nr:DUF4169 family protein [Nitratireductor sp.]MCB1457237.1 DUF4169 family protein [Nitratireductor sp.]MCB1459519.1 DUF4169 family protein [Nitratireductor sp.]